MYQGFICLPVVPGILHHDLRAWYIALYQISAGSNRSGCHLVWRCFVSGLCYDGTFQHNILEFSDFQVFVELELYMVII